MAQTDRDRFLELVERTFGREDTVLKHARSGESPVHVLVYRDQPRAGMLTGVTFGVSQASHPSWVESHHELIVSVESSDPSWAFAAAYFGAEFRGKRAFCAGETFTTDTPLAKDSSMDGLLAFAPSIVALQEATLSFEHYRATFVQLYPIYRSEVALIGEIGLEAFWKHEGFSMTNVKRAPIAVATTSAS